MTGFERNNNYYYIAVVVAITLCLANNAIGQTVSSSGQDFWLGYGAHAAMYNTDGTVNASGGTQEMRLYISARSAANVTVSMPLTGFSKTITVAANSVNQEVVIPKSGASDARLTAEGLANKGIHITSDNPVSAYAHIYNTGSSASTLLMPTEMLGEEYYTLGVSQAAAEKNSFSWCFVVATEDATTVEITPAGKTLTHAAGVPFTISLNKGQVYTIIGAATGSVNGINTGADLTGTEIRTLGDANKPCKKIAVFTGSSNTLVSCSGTGTGDNIFKQAFPSRAWGKTFFCVPTTGMPNNKYRVLFNKPTKVLVDGVSLPALVNSHYYEFTTSKPCKISADNPVVVGQIITSQGQCNNTASGGNGDPELIYISPTTCYAPRAIINLPINNAITSHYINIVLRTIAIDSFRLDNINRRAFFKTYQQDPNYSYAQIPLGPGMHSLDIDTLGFFATAYGYGNEESYGLNAAINITSLSAIAIKNPYSKPIETSPCKQVPFNFVYTLKRRATRLVFDYLQNPSLSPNNTLTINNPVVDSAYFNGSDSQFRYILPVQYLYAPDGKPSFKINITEDITTAEGCIETRTVSYTINVNAKPAAGINVTYNTCGDSTLAFKDASTFADGRFKEWLWKFGDGTSSSGMADPVKTYKAYGDYTVGLRAITNNGCYADTAKKISLNPLPKVNFGISGQYCPLNNIFFTDSTKLPTGWQVTKRQWYFGDGTTLNDSINPIKQYKQGGTYTVKLIATSNKNCIDSAIKTVTIYDAQKFTGFITVKNPTATVNTLQVCSGRPFGLAVTFTARQAQISWDFATNTALTPNSKVTISPAVPDSVYFNGQDSCYRYTLPGSYVFAGQGTLPVKVTAYTLSKGGCLIPTDFNYTIQVLAKPVAAWALTYNSCSNDTLHFNNASGAAGDSITTWQWNFADGSPIINVASPVKKYAAYGEYNVTLHITTAAGCYADTTGAVALSPAPVANFGYTGPLFCVGSAIAFTDSSTILQPFTITKWAWDFGDQSTAAIQNPAKQYAAAGTYTVRLVIYSNHNCTDTAEKTISIYNYPGISMPHTLPIPAGTPVQIKPVYTGTGLTYLWQPPGYLSSDTAAMPIATPPVNSTYLLTVTGDGGCSDTASITIVLQKPINIPNVFSPNGDGINDTWRVENLDTYPACSVRIFNRSGQLIFSSTGYAKPWDGTYNGKPLPIGTYYYIIDTKSTLFPGKAGDVTILR